MDASESRRILYAEDDENSAALIRSIVEKEGHAIEVAPDGRAFRRLLAEKLFDLCLLDINLPDASGLDLLLEARKYRPDMPVIMITGEDSVDDVVMAIKRGAMDYMAKPLDVQRFLVTMRNVLRIAGKDEEIASLRGHLRDAYAPEHLAGGSAAMERLRGMIRRVGPSEATVLIRGESGTGKELVARALHYTSPRRDGPFVDVNCASLNASLLESELFGHEKGAFTGASAMRRGLFEQADGGTLFLDEIGDMPPPMQAAILRALDERSFARVGGSGRVSVDVRVICATNRDLDAAVREGAFRPDLFYRINAVTVEVPPLRDRREDIAELARLFFERVRRREKSGAPGFSAEALQALASHFWPGNVRELENAVERAALMAAGEEIRLDHLPPAVRGPAAAPASTPAPPGDAVSLIEAVERLERAEIIRALERYQWNKTAAAHALRITPRMISYKMQNLGIEPPSP
jgi:DNA-binding NtrC family response regulator